MTQTQDNDINSCPSILTGPQPLLPDILTLHGKWRAGKAALVFDGETIEWSELVARAGRIANALHASGVTAGDRVAVVMQNSVETVEALMGVMLAGCASAPMNLTVTDRSLAAMIADCGASAIIATPDQAERLEAIGGWPADMVKITTGAADAIPGWLDFHAWRDAQSDTPPALQLQPDDAFNIIYSSGTTGQPKGILHTHATRLLWARDLGLTLRYHTGARALAAIGLYSNISWVMLLCTWLCGGTLYLCRNFDAGEVLKTIDEEKITHTAMVPVQYQRMADHPEFKTCSAKSMVAPMSCGSPLHGELKAELFRQWPCGVIELYGLTEGLITTLDPEDAEGRLASVGRPMQGTDILILDDENRPCPVGEPGEILGRGGIVMPGYLDREDATKESSWIDEEGRTWLRTGDIGMLDEDGFLYIVDRKKDMILSGGQNIYPSDIEAELLEHEAVGDAAVIGLPHRDWGETPVAIIELASGQTSDAEELLEWTNERVGKRQRLSALHIVPELPRNPNGKILKKALREVYGAISA